MEIWISGFSSLQEENPYVSQQIPPTMRIRRFLPTAVELCLAPGAKEAEYTRSRRLVERRTRLLRAGFGRGSHRTESGLHIRPAIVGRPSPEMARSILFRPVEGFHA